MTCCDGLAAISRNCGINVKGLRPVIEIAEECDVETIPDPDADSHTISTDVTVASTKQFWEWAVADDSQLIANSEGVGNPNDMSFQNNLTVFIPGDEDAADATINAVLNGTFIIRYTSKSGKAKLLGTKASPAKISSIQFTDSPDSKGYLITFMNMGHKPYNYTGAIPLTPVA